MKRFSKILNREISDDEIFQIDNYKFTKNYTDLKSNDTIITHTLRIKFKFDFSDLDSVCRVIYMEELENDHWNTNPSGIMKKKYYFFKTLNSQILKKLV